MLYNLVKYLGKVFLFPFFPYKVIGKEFLKTKGPVIMICNHISLLDPIMLAFITPRQISFIAKVELFHHPLARWFLPRVNAFPVNRHSNDITAIKKSLQVLKDGNIFGIFPEGTRGQTGEIRPFEKGLGFIALKSDALILPIRFKRNFKLFRKQTIIVGKPFKLEGFNSDAITLENINKATEVFENSLKVL
jgi:1-acyl-sn-glycerol-3-phosphate acyltransferase